MIYLSQALDGSYEQKSIFKCLWLENLALEYLVVPGDLLGY